MLQDADRDLSEFSVEVDELRDLGDRILASGRMRDRPHGRAREESGAETESPLVYLVQYDKGKTSLIRAYLDPKEALEALGYRLSLRAGAIYSASETPPWPEPTPPSLR